MAVDYIIMWNSLVHLLVWSMWACNGMLKQPAYSIKMHKHDVKVINYGYA